MNLKKIKLALITHLINNEDVRYPLSQVKKLMKEFAEEVGKFLSIDLLGQVTLNKVLQQENFELKYEKLTVNLQLVRNRKTNATIIKNFIVK